MPLQLWCTLTRRTLRIFFWHCCDLFFNFHVDCLNKSDYDSLVALIQVFNSYFTSKNVKEYIVEMFWDEMAVFPPKLSGRVVSLLYIIYFQITYFMEILVMEAFAALDDLPDSSSSEYRWLSEVSHISTEDSIYCLCQ